jgi:hypothetical protein
MKLGEEKNVRRNGELRGRVLARVIADEVLNNVVGSLGPTSIVTGSNQDITNLDGDNDGGIPK